MSEERNQPWLDTCVDCGADLTDEDHRTLRLEAAPVDLIHEEFQVVGPRCDACDEKAVPPSPVDVKEQQLPESDRT